MPPEVGAREVIAWYEEHMPPGRDFEGMQWLEALADAFDAEEDWYWCAGPARSLDVAVFSDGGVAIQLMPVSDGACG